MATISALVFGCFVLTCVHGRLAKDDCIKGFDKCTSSNRDESECRKQLQDCIDRENYHTDEMIPEKKDVFMRQFKCCFFNLSRCVKHEEKRAKEEGRELCPTATNEEGRRIAGGNVGAELVKCSHAMMGCAMKKRSLIQFMKESPAILRNQFRSYGRCVKVGCVNRCVMESHHKMERLLSMDCLNKYILCAYKSTEGERDLCHTNWTTCMRRRCNIPRQRELFDTEVTNKLWRCTKKAPSDQMKDMPVIDTLKCILHLHKKGMTVPRLLSRQHVREVCFIVYGGDNFTMKTAYENCVKNN